MLSCSKLCSRLVHSQNLLQYTPTLNWSHQFKAAMTTAIEQACKLQSSFAAPAQKLQVYRSKIVAAMRYIFSTTAFSLLDIKRLL